VPQKSRMPSSSLEAGMNICFRKNGWGQPICSVQKQSRRLRKPHDMILMQKSLSFSTRVLEAVKHVPKGKVTTYRELARSIGHPGAARAVGNALNKNPHPIKVPCHRVVRSDGRISGYVLGTKRKIELLRREGVMVKNGKVALIYVVRF
jgi:methylated-DNA-[protein]-cysteine S-methyltransferase